MWDSFVWDSFMWDSFLWDSFMWDSFMRDSEKEKGGRDGGVGAGSEKRHVGRRTGRGGKGEMVWAGGGVRVVWFQRPGLEIAWHLFW